MNNKNEMNQRDDCMGELKRESMGLSDVRYYTYPEVAEILRCSEKTVYNRVKNGELRPFYNGRKVLFTEECIRECLKQEGKTPNKP